MSLFKKIAVNAHYTRSVNVERDASSLDVVNAYIPTSRALRTFERVAESFNEKTAPRAWSLVGPYGSGKSSFSVFLSHLLANPKDKTAQAARSILQQVDKNLVSKYEKHIAKDNDGYFTVLITGSPESLSKRLLQGFAEAAQTYWKQRGGKAPSVVDALNKASKKGNVSTSELVGLIKELQEALDKLKTNRCNGILLMIDELGKFLEYEARHYGANDIYLLQALAEHACAGNKINLLVFVLLHQSFEQYAKGLGENLKNEWSKVQGRFEEIPFLESAEQVLRVVSAAFKPNVSAAEAKKLKTDVKAIVDVMAEQKALPGTLGAKDAVELFTSCYPLHPLSAILLPVLCQKVAQNERTLFSYLGSHEEFGMQDMLGNMSEVGEFIYPHHIYDYFITNQPAVLGDHQTHRRWVEVVTAIERLGDADVDSLNLLKTIGVLNIIGSKGGLKASQALLEVCGVNNTKKAIKNILDKSVVTFRKFSNEFRVWQGSDFDLEEALREELNNLGNFSLAEELNKSKNMLPIVARKYTIQSGALRYFVPTFVDAQTFKTADKQADDPRIIFYLAAGQDDEAIFKKQVKSYFSDLDITVLCLSGTQLREAVAESLALERVRVAKHELNSDPVAKREFEDRFTAALQAEDSLVQALIDSPQMSEWYNQGKDLKIKSRRSLQQAMSEVLERIYSHTPKIANELINRDKPSSQAVGGRTKLMLAMVNHEAEADLGIDKFPPEKAMYRAIFAANDLHKKNKKTGEWAFVAPAKDSDFFAVWQCINQFLDSTEKAPKSFAELNNTLMAPPYGIKAGVLPVLYMAAYVVYQDELALYESRRYVPYFTEEMIERFVKRPDEFTIQRFKIEGLHASLFKQYSKVIHGDEKGRSILELAKPLANFMGGLPEYTQTTRRGIGAKAQEVRAAFNLAKSPERLLFEELPKALGYGDLIKGTKTSEKVFESFAEELTVTLRELKNAYGTMLQRQTSLLAQAFNIDANLELSEVRRIVSANCHGLENYTVDTQGLRAFIMRLGKTDISDNEWLENTLMFLGHKPSAKWLDSDQDAAEYRLSDFSRRVIDLEKLRLHEKVVRTKIDGDFDVYLLRSIKKGGEFLDEVVAVDPKQHKAVVDHIKAIEAQLKAIPNKELALSVLAETVDSFLRSYRGQAQNEDTPKRGRPRKVENE